jgi:hypothetical protein
LIESIEVIFSEDIHFGTDISIITEHLKNFTAKHNLAEAYLIIGINDFRFKTVKLPKDSEDNEFWFDDNADKFLPEGRVSDDFLFSYEKYFEDEDNEYYLIVVTRRNYVESIVKACQLPQITIINISPFTLKVHSLDFAKNKNLLFISFKPEKIIYTYSDNKHNLIFGETFLPSGDLDYEDIDHKNTVITNGLNEIKQNISAFPIAKESELKIMTTFSSSSQSNYSSLIQSVFSAEILNSETLNTKVENITSAIVLNNLFTGKDDSINLLPTEAEMVNSEVFEKKTSLRIILSFGMAIIFLLLSIYLGESLLGGALTNNEEKLIEVESKSKMLENYQNENVKIVSNLSMLNKLKDKRVVYSKILNSLTDCSNNRSCFTNLIINELGGGLGIKIEGLAYSQTDVTEMIKKVEKLENFTNVSLEFANLIERSKYKNKVRLPQNKMIDFSFSAMYNED